MESQVLSVEQCKELLALGIDMSNASALWTAVVDDDYEPKYWMPILRADCTPIEILKEKFPLTYKEGNVYYTFTLQDILDMLPKYIDGTNQLRILCYTGAYNVINFGYWTGSRMGWLHFSQDMNSTINSAFNLLKWCKINNYI